MPLSSVSRTKMVGGVGYKVFCYTRSQGRLKISPQYRGQIIRKPLRGGCGQFIVRDWFPTNRWLEDATDYTIKCAYINARYKSGFHLFQNLEDALGHASLSRFAYSVRVCERIHHSDYIVLPVLFDNVVAHGMQFGAKTIVAKDIYIIDDFDEFL